MLRKYWTIIIQVTNLGPLLHIYSQTDEKFTCTVSNASTVWTAVSGPVPLLRLSQWKCQRLQFLHWPLEYVSNNESFPIDSHVKMSSFTAGINMLKVRSLCFFPLFNRQVGAICHKQLVLLYLFDHMWTNRRLGGGVRHCQMVTMEQITVNLQSVVQALFVPFFEL